MTGMYATETGVPQVETPQMGDIVMIVSPTAQNFYGGLFADFGTLAVVASPGALAALRISGFVDRESEHDYAITLLTGDNKGHVYGVWRGEIAVCHGFIRTLTVDASDEQMAHYCRAEAEAEEPASCRR